MQSPRYSTRPGECDNDADDARQMSGCTQCQAKTGCSHRKGEMLAAVEATLASLYPTRTWGEPDDLARFEAGVGDDDGQALSEELAVELRAATFFREGECDEYCDYIYVLCVGREPCLVQLRDAQVPIPPELDDELNRGQPIREDYLRVCLSQMSRMAAVQEIRMEMARIDGDTFIRELPRPGVFAAHLLSRMQRLVALLPAYDIRHLDFGEISAPPPGFSAGYYASLYGGVPQTCNYLFYPQPSNMHTTTLLLP